MSIRPRRLVVSSTGSILAHILTFVLTFSLICSLTRKRPASAGLGLRFRKGGIRTRIPCTCCGAPSALAAELPSDEKKSPLVPSPPAVRMPTVMTYGILPRPSAARFAAASASRPAFAASPYRGVFASRSLLARPAKPGHRAAPVGTCGRHVRFVHSPASRQAGTGAPEHQLRRWRKVEGRGGDTRRPRRLRPSRKGRTANLD